MKLGKFVFGNVAEHYSLINLVLSLRPVRSNGTDSHEHENIMPYRSTATSRSFNLVFLMEDAQFPFALEN